MKNSPCTIATSVMQTSARRTVIAGDCSVSREQSPIERLDVGDQAVDAVASQRGRSSALAHGSPLFRIAEQGVDRARQAGGIVERRHEGGLLVAADGADHIA